MMENLTSYNNVTVKMKRAGVAALINATNVRDSPADVIEKIYRAMEEERIKNEQSSRMAMKLYCHDGSKAMLKGNSFRKLATQVLAVTRGAANIVPSRLVVRDHWLWDHDK